MSESYNPYAKANRQRIEEFCKILSEKGISELYGLMRGPGESEEQLRERLRIYLLEYP